MPVVLFSNYSQPDWSVNRTNGIPTVDYVLFSWNVNQTIKSNTSGEVAAIVAVQISDDTGAVMPPVNGLIYVYLRSINRIRFHNYVYFQNLVMLKFFNK